MSDSQPFQSFQSTVRSQIHTGVADIGNISMYNWTNNAPENKCIYHISVHGNEAHTHEWHIILHCMLNNNKQPWRWWRQAGTKEKLNRKTCSYLVMVIPENVSRWLWAVFDCARQVDCGALVDVYVGTAQYGGRRHWDCTWKRKREEIYLKKKKFLCNGFVIEKGWRYCVFLIYPFVRILEKRFHIRSTLMSYFVVDVKLILWCIH